MSILQATVERVENNAYRPYNSKEQVIKII